jgi:hypothetical protein
MTTTTSEPVLRPRSERYGRIPMRLYVCRHCGHEVWPVDTDDDTNDNWYHLNSCEERRTQ